MSTESDNDSGDGHDPDHHGRISRDSTSPVNELSSHLESSPKRRRRRRGRSESTVDRISKLSDHSLLHILSFLPIEDAIKTQLLSKRWQYLWTYLPSLVFRSYRSDFVERDVFEFADFVDRTLTLCKCSKLKKFAVNFRSSYDPRTETKVNLWTRFAVGKGTEVLHLNFNASEDPEDPLVAYCPYELPRRLYSSTSFRELHFSLCRVKPKGVVGWNSLKKLSIGYVVLTDELIQKILRGSPVLEILELYYFQGVSRLHLSYASLKKLILREYWDDINNSDDSKLEISAPYLQSLEMLGCLERKNCRLLDVSSLVDATLSFDLRHEEDVLEDYERDQNILRRLLESLAHVKNITLGTWALQVLSIMEAKFSPSPLLKCVCLTLDVDISKTILPGIQNLLGSSPNLETLVITLSPSNGYHEHFGETLTKLCDFDEKLYWKSQKRAFGCLMLHLKKVKFAGVRWLYHDMNFAFVQFLLENARVLQKMVFDALRDVKMNMEFVQKILSFPRSSPNAMVMFYE
ncbi:hypothetical protein C3L33_06326, partial [Rhododendron williamsianum]